MSEKFRDSQWDRHGVIGNMLKDVKLPKMVKVHQKFEDNGIKDIPAVIKSEMSKPQISKEVKPGQSIAITVGSRGIANIALITKEVIKAVKELGGNPFIVPAMGSHGGATAEGQKEMLAGYGVTEELMGAPIKSSMEVKMIGYNEDGKPTYIDKYAAEADGIIVVGRIKPHTAFRGEYESGLFKMLTIGLGKHKGAETCHAEGFKNMGHNVPAFARAIMENSNILFGIGIIENAFDETCKIVALTKEEIPVEEPKLLLEAKSLMPRIMFDKFDILIVDQIGKNFSGDGADPNITATYCTPYASGGPEFTRYIVLDLSDETHGNAIGAGMAHFTTKRLFDKADFDATYPNSLTSRVPDGGAMPMVLKSDKLAVQAAIYTCSEMIGEEPRIVRIPNTSHISYIYISEALIEEAKTNPNIEILEEPKEFDFDGEGNLSIGGH